MKKKLRLKLVLTIMSFISSSLSLHAQYYDYLNSNNVNAGIGIGGNLFTTTTPTSYWDLFEVPAGSGKREIYTAALWMTGRDQGYALHCAAQRYFDYGNDYFDGPIVAIYNTNYDNYYKRIFKVSQAQISNFTNLNFPVNASQIDSSIRYWPAKGNACVLSDYGVNIDTTLAPFVDLNHNGIYEPILGDYPAVLGDENIFFVFNDMRNAHTQTNGTPLGVEVRGLASSYVDYDVPSFNAPINNTVFVRYEIQNKSSITYTNYNLGLFVDPDIGCFDNDFVGCDTDRSMMFAYNGTSTDPDCAPELGYGSTNVALGIQMLNRSMSVFGYFTSGDGNSDDPITAAQYDEYLNGLWGDGTPFEFGHSGYNTGGAVIKFIFPGDPTDSTGWSEVTSHDVPSDRRMYAATGPSTFNPGETINFDLGFTTAYDNSSNNISIVDSLKQSADVIRQFYNESIQTVGVNPLPAPNQFAVSLYPNPAHNNITIITTGDNIQSIELMDIEGRVLLRKTVEAKYITLPVSFLAKGVYLVNVQGTGTSVIKKIVIQ